jgi:hypothetical protein
LFDSKEQMGLKEVWNLCAGFKQLQHLDVIQEFNEAFFDRIEEVVCSKPCSISEAYYQYLQPDLIATDEHIARFVKFLAKLESVAPENRKDGADRLINWVKDSIQNLNEKTQARAMSQEWTALN